MTFRTGIAKVTIIKSTPNDKTMVGQVKISWMVGGKKKKKKRGFIDKHRAFKQLFTFRINWV